MGKKLDGIRTKAAEAKAKWKERNEKFKQDHPVISDYILKAKVVGGMILIWGIPVALAYSAGLDEGKTKKIFDETNYEVEHGMNRFMEGPADYIDKEGQFHQDIGYGMFAVWPNKETYLLAETQRINEGVPTLNL